MALLDIVKGYKVAGTKDSDDVSIYQRKEGTNYSGKFQYTTEEVSEKDTGYRNRWGFRTWGIDYYNPKDTTEHVAAYQSDYSSFTVLYENPVQPGEIELECISVWESIFWGSPYGELFEPLREALLKERAVILYLQPPYMQRIRSANKDEQTYTTPYLQIVCDKYIIEFKDYDALKYTGIIGTVLCKLIGRTDTLLEALTDKGKNSLKEMQICYSGEAFVEELECLENEKKEREAKEEKEIGEKEVHSSDNAQHMSSPDFVSNDPTDNIPNLNWEESDMPVIPH